MKKALCLTLVIVMLLCSLSVPTFAQNKEVPQWQDIYIPDSQVDDILEYNTNNSRAAGLILTFALGIKKDGNNLIIAGSTNCTYTVVKCGFKEVVIQRRANSTQEWQDYVTYEDLYYDSSSYMLSKSITVATGYQYRVTAIHYAKKNIFSTEKIDNVSNIVTM